MTTEEMKTFVSSLTPEQAAMFLKGIKDPPTPETDDEKEAKRQARLAKAEQLGQKAAPWLGRVGLMGLGALIAGGIAYATGAVDPFNAAMETAKKMR
jgi:hypothetical protein